MQKNPIIKRRRPTVQEESKTTCVDDACGQTSGVVACTDPATAHGINNLPNELMLHVFSWLPIEDLSLNVPHVCARWRKLSNEQFLWRHSKLICNKAMSLDIISQVLSNSPYLKCISIIDREDINVVLQVVSRYCKNLLELYINSPHSVKVSAVRDTLQNSSQLVALEIDCVLCLDIPFRELFTYCSILRTLNIPQCDFLDGELLMELVDQCKCLERLNILYAFRIRDTDVLYLIEKTKDKLISITLDGVKLKSSTFIELKQLQKLQNLVIMNCESMTDESLLGITELRLQTLHLRRGVNLTSQGMVKFLTEADLSRLKDLDLSWCIQLDDEITESLSIHCPSLEWLCLEGCIQITKDGLQRIVAGCSYLKQISILSF